MQALPSLRVRGLVSQPPGVAAVGRAGLVSLALLLGAAFYAVRVRDPDLAQLPFVLLVIPIALCSVAYGLRGGLSSAAGGFALSTAWHLHTVTPLGWLGYGARLFTYLAIGAVIGCCVESRNRLTRELEHHHELSLDLIATANFEGFFTRLNPAWTRQLGYNEQELLARPFLDFVHPDDREATIAAAAQQTEAGLEVLRFENRYRHKDGSYRWLEWASRPDASSRQLIAVARDITDRKLLEEAEQSYKETLELAVRERTKDLEGARIETLRRLALAAEYRDDQTFEHTERVGRTAFLLARELGFSVEDADRIEQAAPLHDIGKLAVSDTILLKPGKLTPYEFEQMKQHASHGSAILAGSSNDVLQLAEEIALTHHEWWDGSGYPAGLRATAIPISGRVVAVADVFDALTHDRPYKKAWTVEDAVDEIRHLSGRQFDPDIVGAFLRLDQHELAGNQDVRKPLRIVA